MSTRRVSKDAGWVSPSEIPKGPNGLTLCRNCMEEIQKGSGRRTFCSDKCVDAWKLRTNPGHVRHLVERRDKGVCAVCQADTAALRKQRDGLEYNSDARREFQRIHRDQFTWEADHIVPVVEGGGECGLDNYRTLCVRCHKQATRELRGRLAQAKRQQKADQRFEAARAAGFKVAAPVVRGAQRLNEAPQTLDLFEDSA